MVSLTKPGKSKAKKGPVKGIRISKAANGHTMEIRREDSGMEYHEPEQRVYGPGQHEQMFTDARQALGIPGGKKKPAPAPKSSLNARVADQMSKGM